MSTLKHCLDSPNLGWSGSMSSNSETIESRLISRGREAFIVPLATPIWGGVRVHRGVGGGGWVRVSLVV